MLGEGLDESLINDFLTESSELIEQLDSDLLELEENPSSSDLLDSIFRALHTIKGAASFLSLPEVTTFAHAAEDALNKLRKGEAEVNAEVCDALLKSVDVIRNQLSEIASGEQPSNGPQPLIDILNAVGSGSSSAPTQDSPAQTAKPTASAPYGGTAVVVEYSPEKADVLPFMVSDLRETTELLSPHIEALADPAKHQETGPALVALADSLMPTADYYDLDLLKQLINLIDETGKSLADVQPAELDELAVRIGAIEVLIMAAADGLDQSTTYHWDISTLDAHIRALLKGQPLPDEVDREHSGDPIKALAIDGISDIAAPDDDDDDDEHAPTAGAATQGAQPQAKDASEPPTTTKTGADQTIRVEVARLEALLNLVGEMVLTKNQVMGFSRQLGNHDLPQEFLEHAGGIASTLDRLTAELQVGVMRTRMQPLHKLFGRYPRIIRDLARKTGKQVNLEIIGGDTEVDKTVLELLGDPLIHMLRNSVDHGLESAQDRVAAGKDPEGTIILSAEHQGGHVRVAIEDNGRGIDREVIGRKAIEKGLTTEELLANMSDEEVFKFIFAAGFSTAAQVSDLSGRGVGMDVVRTNITKLGGDTHIRSVLGQGTSIEILIPLTVAIMPAMMVGVGNHDYAIPLSSIVEIVRNEPEKAHSVAGKGVLRVREWVLPVIDLRDTLNERTDTNTGGFGVVIAVGQERAALIVDRLIGQQEVVIKPLDDEYTSGGPFSGATIREDGEVNLILDVIRLFRSADSRELAHSA